jgi:hypothetical protein
MVKILDNRKISFTTPIENKSEYEIDYKPHIFIPVISGRYTIGSKTIWFEKGSEYVLINLPEACVLIEEIGGEPRH